MYDPELPNGFQDADFEMREFECLGQEMSRKAARSNRLKASGDLMAAAEACPHGGGYPLRSDAARTDKDKRAGEPGFRCLDCGSVLDADPWDNPGIIHPCESDFRG